MQKHLHQHQTNIKKFNNYQQTFRQTHILFNAQQQSNHQSWILPQLGLNMLKQSQVFLNGFKIKSSYLLLLILLTICAYNQIIDLQNHFYIAFEQNLMKGSMPSLSNPGNDSSTWQQFKQKYNKKYQSQRQDLYRCLVFKHNKNSINAHNIKKQRSFNKALNQFADLTAQQFALIYTTTFPSNQLVRNYASNYIDLSRQIIQKQKEQSSINQQNKQFDSVLTQIQLKQILNFLAKQTIRKYSMQMSMSQPMSQIQNQAILKFQNNLLNLDTLDIDIDKLQYSQKKQMTIPQSKSIIQQYQSPNTQNIQLQNFVKNFIQRFQFLTTQAYGKNIKIGVKNKQVSEFLKQNKEIILKILQISHSFMNSNKNGYSKVKQIQINQKMNQILTKVLKNQKINLTSTGPLRQILNIQNLALQKTPVSSSITAISTTNTAITIDWTYHAGSVRYQGICGACYTFAASDAVGSLYSIYKYGFFIPLSTQQVIDCSNNGLTYGCGGGFLQGSFAYMQVRGITTDYSYPYVSSTNAMAGECKFQGGNFKISLFKSITAGSCPALIEQLKYGPVSIGIAGYRLQFYSTGVFNDCNSYIDHAVVLIGYKAGVGWKIKNSWGNTWGINGFGWIADGNNCGICDMAVAPKL